MVWNRVWLLDVVVFHLGCARVQYCNYSQKPGSVIQK